MKPASKPSKNQDIAKRWHPELADDNWTPIISFFLKNYYRVGQHGMSHGEAMFVIHLMSYKWDDKDPYPSHQTLAKMMGVTDKSTRRYALSLVQKNLLKRKMQKGETNRFDLSPLMEALVKLKKEGKNK